MTTDTILASPPPAMHDAGTPRSGGIRSALRSARAALQWRLLLWWALLLLLPTVVAALPVWQLLSASFDHSVYAPRLAGRLDMIAYADIVEAARGRYAPALGAGNVVALALTLLLSPLLSGMAVAAARAPRRLGCGTLLAAGAQEYPRLARMLVWSAIPLGIAALLGASAYRLAGAAAATALLQSDAERADRLALLATSVLLVVAHATVDIGRAVLAGDSRRSAGRRNAGRRTSAFAAWQRGCALLLRRPLALLGTYAAVTAIGLAAAGLLAFARLHVPALGMAGTAGAVVLAQLAVVVLGWMRAARLFALVALVGGPQSGGPKGACAA
jgi:hypothetical protein